MAQKNRVLIVLQLRLGIGMRTRGVSNRIVDYGLELLPQPDRIAFHFFKAKNVLAESQGK